MAIPASPARGSVSSKPDRGRRGRGGLLFTLAVSVLLVASGIVAFFVVVRGEEEILVPDVAAADLLDALVMLQEKALAPRVEDRHSSDHAKWQVIEQDPQAGTLVKAGRPVLLVVSRGPIIDRVGHYVGRDLEEVRLELQTAFASYRALITIREPVARVTDPSAAGTILAQNPPADTPVAGEMELELVVSKGPGGDLVELADYVGRPALEVRDELAGLNVPFVFRIRAAREGDAPASVVSQSPAAGQEMPYSSILQLEMTVPGELDEGMVFGLVESALPEYPILVDLKLEVMTPGETRTILATKHPGGPIGIPYVEPAEGQLVLSMFGDEILTRPTR
jgi:beta-lactam-binding protein with PASTA domain